MNLMGRLARRRHAGMQRGPAPILRALLGAAVGSLERAGLIERRPTRAGRGFEYHLSIGSLHGNL